MKPKLHILSSTNSPVHPDNIADPYSPAVLKFVKYMTILGWTCIVYTIVGSEITGAESVQCLNYLTNDRADNMNKYNAAAAIEIKKRKTAGDFILCFNGLDNYFAAQSNSDLTIVEPSIGYDPAGIFAPYRVFTSYSQMHYYYGMHRMMMTPSWWDTVIPNSFDPSEFDYQKSKEDYLLIFGRVIETKGIHIAIQISEKLKIPLVIAGPGTLESMGYVKTPPGVTVVGLCDRAQRRDLMSRAKAILGPTYYIEPFGNMIVEGYFSGTPAITTDWGGFVDTVVNGVTGYRCREFKQFLEAVESIDQINPEDCLNYAINNYSESVVHNKFDEYFQKLTTKNFYRI